ncbi:MAG TPA: hypothetical protein EYN66_18300, partial [Myxococcales bacterium]|nr:hypothetical protein [Myxococcales bacterium]
MSVIEESGHYIATVSVPFADITGSWLQDLTLEAKIAIIAHKSGRADIVSGTVSQPLTTYNTTEEAQASGLRTLVMTVPVDNVTVELPASEPDSEPAPEPSRAREEPTRGSSDDCPPKVQLNIGGGNTAAVTHTEELLARLNRFPMPYGESSDPMLDLETPFTMDQINKISGVTLAVSLISDPLFDTDRDWNDIGAENLDYKDVAPSSLITYRNMLKAASTTAAAAKDWLHGTSDYLASMDNPDSWGGQQNSPVRQRDADTAADWLKAMKAAGEHWDTPIPPDSIKNGHYIQDASFGWDLELKEIYKAGENNANYMGWNATTTAVPGTPSRPPTTWTPYMGGGRQGAFGVGLSNSYSLRQLYWQAILDHRFLEMRGKEIWRTVVNDRKLISSEEVVGALDEGTTREQLERLGELQEKQRNDPSNMTPEERAELERLQASNTPRGLQERSDATEDYAAAVAALTPAAMAQKMRALEQCFLLKNIAPLSHASINRKITYRHADSCSAHHVHGKLGETVSKLMYDPNYSAFYFLPPSRLSYLTPSIKIYQVLHDYLEPTPGSNDVIRKTIEEPAGPVDFEVPFFQHITEHAMEQVMNGHSGGRGGAIALNSFDWEYQGSNPASSRRDIKADLSIMVQNFEDL